MRRGEVDGVVVGADRIAANGDTANKIGTYSVARAGAASTASRSTWPRRSPPSTSAIAGRRRHPDRGARPRRGHVRSAASRSRPRARRRGTRRSTSRRPPTSPPSSPRPACCGPRSGRRWRPPVTPGSASRERPAVHACGPYLMAAGLGTRLYPLTGLTSKPMVPILNRPVMEHLLHLLRRHGVTEIAANLHYHPDKIRSYFGDGSEFGVELRYNLEEHLLGTAGGADAFREFLSASTLPRHERRRPHRHRPHGVPRRPQGVRRPRDHGRQGGRGPLAVRRRRARRRHARRAASRRSRRARRRSPRCATAASTRSSRRSSTTSSRGAFVDWAKDVFPALLDGGLPFHCWELESYWNDVGNIEQYRLSNFDALLGYVTLDVPGRAGRPGYLGRPGHRDRGRRASRAADPVWAPAASIESGAELIGPLIIGDGCVVERGAVLEGVIQWDGAKAGRGSRLAGSILGRNVVVHHEAVVREDAVIGDRSEVAPHTLVDAGARARTAYRASDPTGTTPAVARRDGAAESARGGRTRRLAGSRLPQALRRLPRTWFLALRAPAPRTPPAARRPLPALRRAPQARRPAGAHRRRRAAHAGLPRVCRPRSRVLGRHGGVLLRGAGARPRHRLQVPRPPLAHRRTGGTRRAGVRAPVAARAGAWRRRHLRPGPPRPPAGPRIRPRRVVRPAACPGRPGSLMLRCSAACATAPARAGSTGPRARPMCMHAFALREGDSRVGTRFKRVIIVDDVYTTGETLNQCAEVLAQAALDPHVFTFARAVRATPAAASRYHAVPKERCR